MNRQIVKSGLRYYKIDLHVHTPGSHDYDDRTIKADAIIKKALDQGLDAIAVTDHNTGEFIDAIKKAAIGRLIVFPGVEISVAGGKEGNLHIIGLFDSSATTKHIENLLGAIGINSDKYGTEEAFSPKSIFEVIAEIHKRGGLPILAHANSSHGALNDIKGNPRTELIQDENVAAVEATDFDNASKKAEHKRVYDLLDGSDPTYQVKKAVYQSSDSHSLAGIGSRYTYFKMDEISLEGLNQCFFDPDVRIQQMDRLKPKSFPRITQLSINSGFLKDQTIVFHEGLNCLIGGKGVGKSLIIELLRFGLNQCSKDKTINADHFSKIEKRLGSFGEIVIEFELDNNEMYRIARTFDGATNPIKCNNLKTNEIYSGALENIFPILAYSQNEIIRTADDPESQLRLIDSFIDTSSLNQNIRSLELKLLKIDKDLAESIDATSEAAGIKIELESIAERLKNIDKALKNDLYSEIKQWERTRKIFDEHIQYHDSLKEKLVEIKDDLSEIKNKKNETGDREIQKALTKISLNSYDASIKNIDLVSKKIEDNKEKIQEKFNLWLPKFLKKQTDYEAMIKSSGGNQASLESERRKLNDHHEKLTKEYNRFSEKIENFEKIIQLRKKQLDSLDGVYNEYYAARKQIFDRLNASSQGKLSLSLNQKGNRENFKEELLKLKKGSKIRETDIIKISEKILPRDFVDYLIRDDATNLANLAEIDGTNAQKLIDSLMSKDELIEILQLAYTTYPEDIPEIKFKKDDGNYYPLSELSVGQKSIALLVIALSEGLKPIIIDQPEDSLDNPSVYEDIVSKLREGKEKRQFILTTHNSNIGVASDSDNFIVLKSSARTGNVECSGAIDKSTVRTEIINHLEGGDIPYELKSKKYHLN